MPHTFEQASFVDRTRPASSNASSNSQCCVPSEFGAMANVVQSQPQAIPGASYNPGYPAADCAHLSLSPRNMDFYFPYQKMEGRHYDMDMHMGEVDGHKVRPFGGIKQFLRRFKNSDSRSEVSRPMDISGSHGRLEKHGSLDLDDSPPRLRDRCSSDASQLKYAKPKRSASARIGPQEFVEMFRERAYSDCKENGSMSSAVANIRARRTRIASNGPLSPLCGGDQPHVIVWCDKETGTQVFRLPDATDPVGESVITSPISDGVISTCGEIPVDLKQLLARCICYDLMPVTGKVVMLDSGLSGRAAVDALVYNSLLAACVWDARQRCITGILTSTDLIRVLVHYSRQSTDGVSLEDIESQSIKQLMHQLTPGNKKLLKPSHSSLTLLVSVGPASSLLEAARLMSRANVRRLPVIDPTNGDLLYLLTRTHILSLIRYALDLGASPPSLNRSIGDLSTFSRNPCTISMTAPLQDLLDLMLERELSCVPVLEAGEVVAVYSRSAVLKLVLDDRLLISNVRCLKELRVCDALAVSCAKFVRCGPRDMVRDIVIRMIDQRCDHAVVFEDGMRESNVSRVAGVISEGDLLRGLVDMLND